MTQQNMTKPKQVVFRLVESELVRNSPYRDGASGVILDIPPFRNVPWKCTITEKETETIDGEQYESFVEREIRYVRGAQSIYLDEQIKAGIKAERKPTKAEMDDLVIKDGELIAVHPNQIRYLMKVPYNKDADVVRQPNTRVMFQAYDKDKAIDDESRQAATIIDAYVSAKNMSVQQQKDFLTLKRLWIPGMKDSQALTSLKQFIDGGGAQEVVDYYSNITAEKATVAKTENSPDGQNAYNENLILTRNLVEKGLISLTAVQDQVVMIKDGKNKKLVDLQDGDIEGKEERFALMLCSSPATKKILLALSK